MNVLLAFLICQFGIGTKRNDLLKPVATFFSVQPVGEEEPYYFSDLINLDIDENGHLYVLSAGDQCLLKMTTDRQLLLKSGRQGEGPGEFGFRKGLMRSGCIEILPDGNLAVLNKSNNRIQIFNDQGHFINEFKVLKMTSSIAVNSKGHIYALSNDLGSSGLITVYDLSGKVLCEFGESLFEGQKPLFPMTGMLVINEKDEIFTISAAWPVITKYNANSEKCWRKTLPKGCRTLDRARSNLPDIDNITGKGAGIVFQDFNYYDGHFYAIFSAYRLLTFREDFSEMREYEMQDCMEQYNSAVAVGSEGIFVLSDYTITKFRSLF